MAELEILNPVHTGTLRYLKLFGGVLSHYFGRDFSLLPSDPVFTSNINFCLLAVTEYTFLDFYLLLSEYLWAIYTGETGLM